MEGELQEKEVTVEWIGGRRMHVGGGGERCEEGGGEAETWPEVVRGRKEVLKGLLNE